MGVHGLGSLRSLEARISEPIVSSDAALRRMRQQRRRDTAPEMALRRRLHAQGLRYRVDAPLPTMRRRADLLFSSARVAVFVDGCFWHGCPEHGTQPMSNASWWAAKLAANVDRDRDTDRCLASLGWTVIRSGNTSLRPRRQSGWRKPFGSAKLSAAGQARMSVASGTPSSSRILRLRSLWRVTPASWPRAATLTCAGFRLKM